MKKSDDRKTLDGFVKNYVVPYRKKLAQEPQHTLVAQLPKASLKLPQQVVFDTGLKGF